MFGQQHTNYMEKSNERKNPGTRAIIICAGEASRWGNHLDTPKHLIEIEGERILNRTVRLLNERGIKDVHVVVKEQDDRYSIEGSRLAIVKPDYEKNADADKFLSSQDLWNTNGRTIVLYGDVYFSDQAMNTICNHNKSEWTLFCRPGPSKITGTPWGECFAQSFINRDIYRHRTALERIARLYKEGILKRCGGWEHYRAMVNRPDEAMRAHAMTTNFVEIDDWTDDFDYPKDLIEWMRRRKIHNETKTNSDR